MSNLSSEYIFIVGLPRTGTKLMMNVLNGAQGHSAKITPENFFLGRAFLPGVRRKMSAFGDLAIDTNVERFVAAMYSGKFHGDYWDRLADGRMEIDPKQMVEAILETDRTHRAIYEVILTIHCQNGETLLGDKTGPHLYHVPTLLEWFPEAKVVHTFRDPRAILVSEHKKRLEQLQRRANKSLRNGEWVKAYLLRGIRPIVSLLIVFYITFAWLRAARLHYRYKRLYPSNYRLSKFEDLVSDPEKAVQDLCLFLGLEFDQEMLHPPKVDSSYERDASSGFDTRTLTRWRQSIQPWMKVWLSFWGGRYLKKFNYVS